MDTLERIDIVLRELKARADAAHGNMEGTCLEDFCLYEGEWIAYTEAYRMLAAITGELKQREPVELKDLDL